MTTPNSDTPPTLEQQVSGSSSVDIDTSIPVRGPEHICDEEGPWAQKTVLTFGNNLSKTSETIPDYNIIDGGGIRGYASLLVLKHIMTTIRTLKRQPPDPALSSRYYSWMGPSSNSSAEANQDSESVDDYLPCHYFDYIAGTSTGGLSSIMLGRLRLSVDEALDTYKAFGNAVFGKPRRFHERSILWWPRAKYSCRKTRAAFQDAIHKALKRQHDGVPGDTAVRLPQNADTEPLKYREDRTRTIAISWLINKDTGVNKQFVWRSYDHHLSSTSTNSKSWTPPNTGPAHTTAIWVVARATTAAPVYFESIKIGRLKFLDGGMVANNPSLTVLREVRRLHNGVPALFVSIGTGLKVTDPGPNGESEEATATTDDSRHKQFLKKYSEILEHWKKWMVDCEGDNGTNGWNSECEAIELTHHPHHRMHRYRLNVKGKLHTIPLDDWRPCDTGEDTLRFIQKQTEDYLNEESVADDINMIAQRAVDIRRRRAAMEQWERFAVDVTYRLRFWYVRSVVTISTNTSVQTTRIANLMASERDDDSTAADQAAK
ncbi:hypothetical protein FPOAC1_007637 [Fusarium poae]|uniref:hypothetical protein n=1 Tax=Fusarium poae TaxID=36050 RepID=UPI001CEA0651|nr:hypothetical protein FPOAC1_007637 [Fusarium poae]KAG8668259.1 hypothetical protein FPOAC1_007637 [Fusarium poae]